MTLHQEIARRTILCQLDAGVPQPWRDRKFTITNLPQWLTEHRSDLIWAVLTLVRNWVAMGKPKGTRMLGMFESYCEVIGGVLASAGIDHFLDDDALVDADEVDLQTEAESWLARSWWTWHEENVIRARDLLSWATHSESPVVEYWGPTVRERDFARQLGYLLRSMTGKTYVIADVNGGTCSVKVQRCKEDTAAKVGRYQLRRMQV